MSNQTVRSILLAVLFLLLTGCGGDLPVNLPGNCALSQDDMGLEKTTFSWPIQGGLDTKRGPLAVASGSNLLVQDVRQDRLGEWRRRDGFTQAGADTMPEGAPYWVGNLGPGGLFEDGIAGLSSYSPSLASGRWGAQSLVAPPLARKRTPIIASDVYVLGFARAGNIVLAAVGGPATMPALTIFDAASGSVVSSTTNFATSESLRGAATASKAVIFSLVAGTITAYVVDAATGALTTFTVKSGLSTTQSELDANWYGGTTITVVGLNTANHPEIMEFNPATGAVASDVALTSVTAGLSLSLLADPDQSGVRFVASSHTTPTTRVTRVSNVGAILSDDQVEAVTSSQIVGCASNAGANWSVVYKNSSTNAIRVNNKTGGGVAGPADFQGAAVWNGTAQLDSQAWRDPGSGGWNFLLGLHSSDPLDPQDTWVEMFMPLGSNAPGVPISTIAPLGAGGASLDALTRRNGTYQVMSTAAHRFSMVLPVDVVYEDNAGIIVQHWSLDLFETTYLAGADLAASVAGPPVPYGTTSFVPAGNLSFYDNGTLKPLGTRYPPRILAVTPSVGAGLLLPSNQYQYVAVVEQIDSDGNVWQSPPSEPALLTMSATQNTNTLVYSSWGLEPAAQYRLAIYRTAGDGSAFRRIYSQLFFAGADITYVDLLSDDAIGAGQFLYTTGELPTGITPPASYAAVALGRLWLIDREHPSQLPYSKTLRPGRLPEFNDVMLVPIQDECGDPIRMIGLDDKLVVWKGQAVYVVSGSGFDDAGGGTNYTVTRIATDVGAILGSPVISLGDTAYFVSARGISMIDAASNVTFMGSPVDLYLHQPQFATPETIRAIVYSSAKDEIRFVTNASVLVYNRTFAIWSRWVGGLATGSPLAHSLMVNGLQWIFREDGTVYVEGDTTVTKDGATDFQGFLRSPYMVPNGPEGRLRVYSGRVQAIRTAWGSPILPQFSMLFDYDDSTAITFDPPAPLLGTNTVVRLEGKPLVTRQSCNTFAEQITFPASDNTFRIERWGAVVGAKPGYSRLAQSQQWKQE